MNHVNKISYHIDYFTTKDDNKIRYGIWPCNKEPVGSVVILNGRSEFLEKYIEPIGKLNQRNYDVYSLDWRGQGLSSRSLKNRHKGHVEDFQNYVDDLYVFVKKIVQADTEKPVMALAHSMGGHIMIRFLHDHPGVIKKAVLTAPMVKIRTDPIPTWFFRLISRMMASIGLAGCYALGSGNYVVEKQVFEGNKLTSDPVRYRDHINCITENPNLALGGVTYGWLSAACDSIGLIHSQDYAEAIVCPVLIVGAGRDRIVSLQAEQSICRKMPNGNFFLIHEAKHEILKESDEIQCIFWDEFDRFISHSF